VDVNDNILIIGILIIGVTKDYSGWLPQRAAACAYRCLALWHAVRVSLPEPQRNLKATPAQISQN
jgi:hypothetical protein